MGGPGSGGWNRTGRSTVEAHPALEAGPLRRAGALADGWRGVWGWRVDAGERVVEVALLGGRDRFRVRHPARAGEGDGRWRPVEEVVPVGWRAAGSPPLGVAEPASDGALPTARHLSDGVALVWAHAAEDGTLDSLSARWTAAGLPARIGDALVPDRDPGFRGFAAQQERDAAQARVAHGHEEEFHKDVLAHAAGGIAPGTVGELKAKIAVELLYRPRLVGHRIGPYAARAAGESCSSLTAVGGLKPCRSINQVAS